MKLLEIANSVEPVQDGRVHIEKISVHSRCNDKSVFSDPRFRIKLAFATLLTIAAFGAAVCTLHP